jgi:hypothetical protein
MRLYANIPMRERRVNGSNGNEGYRVEMRIVRATGNGKYVIPSLLSLIAGGVVCLLCAPPFSGAAAAGEPPCSREGDAALYVDFGGEHSDIEAGKTVSWNVAPGNFGFVSASCSGTDTFCLHIYDTAGWTITAEPPIESCHVLEPAYIWWQNIGITAPCDVAVCDNDTLIIVMVYCDGDETCNHECRDTPGCEDPNWYGGAPYYSADTVILHVVESAPALHITQDSLSNVGFSQSQNYVPFSICNGDPCADANAYNYTISCTPLVVGSLCTDFPQSGSTGPILGGECENVYAVVDAGVAEVCDMAELTIIAWDAATGTVYDTCVQVIHCVPIMPVPLTTPAAIVIITAAVITTAFFMMRKRCSGRVRASG